MADEIQYRHNATGVTCYAVLVDMDGDYYETNAAAFEAVNTTDWNTNHYFDIALTEISGTYHFQGTMPAVSAGWYRLLFFEKGGANSDVSDILHGEELYYWDGTDLWPESAGVAKGGALALTSGRVDVGKWVGTTVTLNATTSKPDVDVFGISSDATAADNLELLTENALGADNKLLLSTDAQDLSASLDVNTKTMTADVITASIIADNAITADQLADDAITGAVLATDSIGPDALAAAAAIEIRNAITGGAWALSCDSSGRVRLAANGLDAITTGAISGVASTFPEMCEQTWRRFFKKADMTTTELKTYADNGTTVLTTQTVDDDGSTQTIGAAA